MRDVYYPDWLIRRILRDTNTIAMVGVSPRWIRPSYFAMKYLQTKGYTVVPVNPRAAGEEILGEPVYASLLDVPGKVDLVDIFRRADQVGPVVDEAIEIGAPVAWMQLGIRNDEVAARAEAAGLTVIMNRCVKIEYGRLTGELGWQGINTRVITSRRSKRIRA
ncbi:MAG: CoA-binding protein [Alphaproteobacteria bacterium]